MRPLIKRSAITIAELKEFVKDLPETDRNGDDYTLWVGDGNNSTNEAFEIWKLNEGDLCIDIRQKGA